MFGFCFRLCLKWVLCDLFVNFVHWFFSSTVKFWKPLSLLCVLYGILSRSPHEGWFCLKLVYAFVVFIREIVSKITWNTCFCAYIILWSQLLYWSHICSFSCTVDNVICLCVNIMETDLAIFCSVHAGMLTSLLSSGLCISSPLKLILIWILCSDAKDYLLPRVEIWNFM